jgi:hypothetical protein
MNIKPMMLATNNGSIDVTIENTDMNVNGLK